MIPYVALRRDKALPGGRPLPVYGVCGDAFLQRRVIEALTGWILEPEDWDQGVVRADGTASTIAEVLALAAGRGLWAPHTIVVVRNAEKLEGLGKSEEGTSKKSKKTEVSPAKHLADGLAAVSQDATLILARTPETPEPGARAGTARVVNAAVDKEIERIGLLVDCNIEARNTALPTKLVADEAAARNIRLSNDAAATLVERCGKDMERLFSELEKCSLRAGTQLVDRAIIEEMTRRQPQDSVFDLTDAIGARQSAKALGVLKDLVSNGEPPELVLTMLVRHLRQLLQARALLDAGLSLDGGAARRIEPALAAQFPQDGRDNLVNLLQSQNWLGQRLGKQASRFTMPQLQSGLEAVFAADLAIKGIEGDGGFDSKVASAACLELLIAHLCG